MFGEFYKERGGVGSSRRRGFERWGKEGGFVFGIVMRVFLYFFYR